MYRFLFCLFVFQMYAEKVDIIASFHFDELDPEWKIRAETLLEVRSLTMGFGKYLDEFYSEDVQKVICMQNGASGDELMEVPREKRILVIWEPGGEGQEYCDLFERVYTYNDLLVDGKTYFKFHYPVLMPMCAQIPDFRRKKFAVMISHTAMDKRIQMIRFFETCPEEDFDYFGFNPMIPTNRYRGPVPSHPLSQEKFDVLKNYRFCICFENSSIPGYITEKIFGCFAAGCVPVYWGAPNIESYIPKDCFIDYQGFQSDEELYRFLKGMSRDVYKGYLKRIGAYLKSEQARVFSAEHFNEMLLELTSVPHD